VRVCAPSAEGNTVRSIERLLLLFLLLLIPGAARPTPIFMLQAAVQGDPDIVVWVNTNSGVYHCPGTHWYGNTKVGKYMKQSEAQKKGYRPSRGKVCR
jgi:hypothetical protein